MGLTSHCHKEETRRFRQEQVAPIQARRSPGWFNALDVWLEPPELNAIEKLQEKFGPQKIAQVGNPSRNDAQILGQESTDVALTCQAESSENPRKLKCPTSTQLDTYSFHL